MVKRCFKRSDITDAMVCKAYASTNRAIEFADAFLMRETGAPEKVVGAAITRAADRNLIDYGVTARSGWLTDAGRALLAQAEPS